MTPIGSRRPTHERGGIDLAPKAADVVASDRVIAAVTPRGALPAYPQVIPNLVDGRQVIGAGDRIAVVDPSRGEIAAHVAEADGRDVDAAVVAARTAFDDGRWSRLPTARRQALLYRAADLIRAEADDLAALETLCAGLPLHASSRRHMHMAADWLTFYGERIGSLKGEHYGQTAAATLVLAEPRGVAGLFAPWNVPVGLAFAKLAPALAAGCTCVLKPSEQTPLATLRTVELLHEAGIPDGVVNLVNGRGPVTGSALANHGGVDCLSFTGGGVAGAAVGQAAAQRHIPAVLELGGKSALIVFADADLDRAIDGALAAVFANNGQACLAGSRILLDESIADAFTERFVARAAAIRVGDPFESASEMGPIASDRHMRSILAFASRVDRGARLLTGGHRLDRPGYYIAPIVACADDPSHEIVQEEIFGPFATLMRFSGETEAWAIANNTRYGLAAYLWTRDHGRVLRGAHALAAGTVVVNAPMIRERNAPFGGWKASGIGSEGGLTSLRFFTREKTVILSDGWEPQHRFGLEAGAA